MHFQLFFPGKTANAAACLSDAGLPDFVEGCTSLATMNQGGGLIIGWAKPITDGLDWRWIDSGDGYRIGFPPDGIVIPADLARRSLFRGWEIKLSDGNAWTVPTASELPSTLRLVDRRWTTVRKPQFDEFWNRSEPWFRRFLLMDLQQDAILADDPGLTADQLRNDWADFCVFCLRQNYRMTPLIASELGLLGTNDLLSVTMAAVDGMNITAVLSEMQERTDAIQAGIPKKEQDSIIHV